jgi:hypothetical protein
VVEALWVDLLYEWVDGEEAAAGGVVVSGVEVVEADGVF